ncbi:MAG: multicopper oxidase domain-containing protein [Candidatus Omnitrophica bacterium]|nr:multicopper oxidase domain-containing protein [Candidatus Omnitrophota bacterium]
MCRKSLAKTLFLATAFVAVFSVCAGNFAFAQSQPTQDPTLIPKYQDSLVIPPVMPKTGQVQTEKRKIADYYEIAVRQFTQQILPTGMPQTTVWGYGSEQNPQTFNYPAFTIEAKNNKPIRVKWINELLDANGNFLPHLFPVDQTLHWANPVGGISGRDMRGTSDAPYVGPVPIVTHLHGGHVAEESDGYPEAWYLPAANNIPQGYATTGTYYDINKGIAATGANWQAGTAIFDYPNDQRATTLWYHDHALGMTRLNVYTGLAGFYLIRGGDDDEVRTLSGGRAKLPGPAPKEHAIAGQRFYEIPIVVQDRSFNSDGSFFYPDSRVYFDGFTGPYAPTTDVAPIWNPEFFGNTIVVNGKTWPYLQVEQRRYRLRFLNGSGSRFLILKFDNNLPFWQIGADGGFLPAPVQLNQLLMAKAERADVIVDFTNVPVGSNIVLQNIGPDEPFNGGPFIPADPNTTGQVMQFRVVAKRGIDTSTPPNQLVLPARAALPAAITTRHLSLNELDSAVLPGVGPTQSLLGTTDLTGPSPMGMPMMWSDAITENPISGDTEVWEFYDFTADAHPIHIHQVQFEVVNREIFDPAYGTVGAITFPQPWETGTKDTVIAYPGQITRVKAKFDIPGQFVWHCHILEHEDNEMMRPLRVTAGPQDIPVAPTNLTTSKGVSTVYLRWKDNSSNETSFEIERAMAETGPFTLMGTSRANRPTFTDSGLARQTTYYYRIRAINKNGASGYSNTAFATTR